jgi:hypothetical protein
LEQHKPFAKMKKQMQANKKKNICKSQSTHNKITVQKKGGGEEGESN